MAPGTQTGTVETHWLPFEGYSKKVTVWLPPEYRQGKACGVLYMLDGQNLFGDHAPYCGGWKADQTLLSIKKDVPYLLVGIDNGDEKRETELTPDLGTVPPLIQAIDGHDFKLRRGKQFARFLAGTVKPAIENKYRVFAGRNHTIIAGSSCGGLEAFYTGLEYPELFGSVAALSPAFVLFEEDAWQKYFKEHRISHITDVPLLFLSNGEGDQLEALLLSATRRMVQRLREFGFPEKKLCYIEEKQEKHNEEAWRRLFPRALSWFLKNTEQEEL